MLKSDTPRIKAAGKRRKSRKATRGSARRYGLRIDPLPYLRLCKNFANWPLCRDSRLGTEWRSFGGGKTVRHILIRDGDESVVTLLLSGTADVEYRHAPTPMNLQVLYRLLADAQDQLAHRAHRFRKKVGAQHVEKQERFRREYRIALVDYRKRKKCGEFAKRPRLKLAFPIQEFWDGADEENGFSRGEIYKDPSDSLESTVIGVGASCGVKSHSLRR